MLQLGLLRLLGLQYSLRHARLWVTEAPAAKEYSAMPCAMRNDRYWRGKASCRSQTRLVAQSPWTRSTEKQRGLRIAVPLTFLDR